jgi:hypothetical protein
LKKIWPSIELLRVASAETPVKVEIGNSDCRWYGCSHIEIPPTFQAGHGDTRDGPVMADDDSYAEWIKTDPPPDLQELVQRYGNYSKISRDMAAWQGRRRARLIWTGKK